jgi:hypothetical protein
MNPPDPAIAAEVSDPVLRLVTELNELRESAGRPSYRQLAARTHYSRSALWRATHGPRLPSRDITLALACACGGDKAEWDRKWCAARAEASARHLAAGESRPAAFHVAPPRRAGAWPGWRFRPGWPGWRFRPGWRGWRGWLAVSAGAAAAAGGLAIITSTQPVAASHPAVSSAGQADGDDPYISRCGADEQRLQFQDLYWPDHQLYGWLELYHSHRCDASWGYIFGPNSARWRVTIVAQRFPGDTSAPSSIQANAPANSWGNVLVTRPGSCVRIEAYITVGTVRGPVAVTECLPDVQRPGIGPPPTPAPPPPSPYRG